MMKRLTAEWLKKKDACSKVIRAFKKVYPKGMPTTLFSFLQLAERATAKFGSHTAMSHMLWLAETTGVSLRLRAAAWFRKHADAQHTIAEFAFVDAADCVEIAWLCFVACLED